VERREGQNCQVQFSPTLAPAAWQNVDEGIYAVEDGPLSMSFDLPRDRGFHRIVVDMSFDPPVGARIGKSPPG
jgi:hypothetical protein